MQLHIYLYLQENKIMNGFEILIVILYNYTYKIYIKNKSYNFEFELNLYNNEL